VLPVPEALAEWIEQHVPRETLLQGGFLFPNPRTGRAWSPASFRRTWARACKAAGLPMLEPYETLRHFTATEWMRRGASEREERAARGRSDAGPSNAPRARVPARAYRSARLGAGAGLPRSFDLADAGEGVVSVEGDRAAGSRTSDRCDLRG
jgi:integrase